MFGTLWDLGTDVAEGVARLTGNDELADTIDAVDDIVEEIFEDE